MLRSKDVLFGELAIALRLLTREQLDDAPIPTCPRCKSDAALLWELKLPPADEILEGATAEVTWSCPCGWQIKRDGKLRHR